MTAFQPLYVQHHRGLAFSPPNRAMGFNPFDAQQPAVRGVFADTRHHSGDDVIGLKGSGNPQVPLGRVQAAMISPLSSRSSKVPPSGSSSGVGTIHTNPSPASDHSGWRMFFRSGWRMFFR